MTEAVLLLALFAAAYSGFALLALSQTRHWRAVSGTDPLKRWQVYLLRAIGALLIAFSLVLSLLRDGPSFGSLLWVTGTSIAALAVAFTLARRPHWLRLVSILIFQGWPSSWVGR